MLVGETERAGDLHVRSFHDGGIALLSQEPLPAAERVREMLTTPDVLRDQYEPIRSSPVVTESSTTYWTDFLITIGVEIEE